MVYGHTLQFFADEQRSPLTPFFVGLANALAFPGFVFAFGYVAHLAYVRGDRPRARVRLLRSAARVLLAFYLSGTAFRVLVDRRPPDLGTIGPIVALSDVPGWSEFLVAFALYALLLAFALPLVRTLLERPVALAGVVFVALLATFLPYDRVTVPQLGLLVGTTRFASFPIVQYLPFFLAGMVVERSGRRFDARVLAMVLVATVGVAIWMVVTGGLPGRFPPTLAWILLPMAPLYAVLLVCRAAAPWLGALATIGARSLVYLLVSNVVIFSVAGTHTGWVLDPGHAAAFAAVTLAATAYLIRLSTRAF